MSRNKDYTITNILVDITKWSGKASFFLFIIGLLLGLIAVNLASPQFNQYETTSQDTAFQWFSIDSNQEVQIILVTENGDSVQLRLEKIEYVSPDSEEVYDFRETVNDTITYDVVFSETDREIGKNQMLSRGEYRLVVNGVNNTSGIDFYLGNAHFDLGLVLAFAAVMATFGLAFGIFATILPFTCIALVVSAIMRMDNQEYDKQVYQKNTTTESTRTRDSPSQTSQQTVRPEPSSRSNVYTRSGFIEDTPLKHLTRNDWIAVTVAGFFLLFFLAEPDGPFLFIGMIIIFIVGYSVTEREKLKNRLTVILQLYPETNLSFLSSQLDKDEDEIIKVLRIMILDEGYPINMNLIEKTVRKIGPFPEEAPKIPTRDYYQQASYETTPETAPGTADQDTSSTESTEDQTAEEDKEEDTTTDTHDDAEQTVSGAVGEITEPALYCSACGEPLKKDVKYCYVCGARQV